MKTLFYAALLLVVGCTSPGEKSEKAESPPVATVAPSALPPSAEFAFQLPTACTATGGDFQVKKLKDDPCLFIDTYHVCVLKRHSKRSKMTWVEFKPGMENPPRYGAFAEVKRTEWLSGLKGKKELRDTCDLQFDVEIAGKIERCHYNRHLKHPDIYCP